MILISQARANLQAEWADVQSRQPGSTAFAMCLADSIRVWSDLLTQVEVQDGTPAERTKFYTALYHSFMAPTEFSEAKGKYLSVDGTVHTLDAQLQGYYTDMSIWDIYRTQVNTRHISLHAKLAGTCTLGQLAHLVVAIMSSASKAGVNSQAV